MFCKPLKKPISPRSYSWADYHILRRTCLFCSLLVGTHRDERRVKRKGIRRNSWADSQRLGLISFWWRQKIPNHLAFPNWPLPPRNACSVLASERMLAVAEQEGLKQEQEHLEGWLTLAFQGEGSGDAAAASPKLASKEPVQPQGKEAVFSLWEWDGDVGRRVWYKVQHYLQAMGNENLESLSHFFLLCFSVKQSLPGKAKQTPTSFFSLRVLVLDLQRAERVST